jgi:lysophospholipase L1-like esterase
MVKRQNITIACLVSLMLWWIAISPAQPLNLASSSSNNSAPLVSSAPTVVFFGSSTTVGFGATRADRRWTTLLSKYFGWKEINEGLSGSTISNADWPDKPKYLESGLQRWRRNVLSRKPDRVIMLYGVNDAFRKIPLGQVNEPNTYLGDLNQMMTEMVKELRPQQLINISSQPNQATIDRRAPYDAGLLTATQKVGGYFIDGQAAFPLADLPAYAADGLHLNDLGHASFASYLANKMVELELEPVPPSAQGGNQVTGQLVALPGKTLLIDRVKPLTFGRLSMLEAQWVGSGKARLVVARPNGRGAYELVYRTPMLTVSKGTMRVAVPNWWVLEGDRLGVWCDSDCAGAASLPAPTLGHFAVPDLPASPSQYFPQAIAIRAVM